MKLELYTPTTALVERQVNTVTYTVRFSNQQFIPQITVIILNNVLFCRGPIPTCKYFHQFLFFLIPVLFNTFYGQVN